jgi:hypothetical protein
MIAPPCLLHERPLVHGALGVATGWPRSSRVWRTRPDRSTAPRLRKLHMV